MVHSGHNGAFQPPENLGAPVNSAGEEIEAFVTADERLCSLSQPRAAAMRWGAYDLYVTHREGDSWTAPFNPGAPINSTAWELSPRLSPDGKLLLFTSSRAFGSTPLGRSLQFDELERRIRAPGNGLRDIYVVRADALLK